MTRIGWSELGGLCSIAWSRQNGQDKMVRWDGPDKISGQDGPVKMVSKDGLQKKEQCGQNVLKSMVLTG
jgi:hypothetical protein